ncbi:Uncharacterized protein PCOAH_00043120 [Plasmodium coatneyi]|uniref:Uncharacterized protein n=1 Tax=Plasmodium coatneyi TaxID=208452 RepID=A0A1B1E5R8_9APIC|nr:Uncharacterized protein PCOAH_00043120 [Plasmodium coatneyi]ANQ10366.1 Uncharacterized protein PCOAH_00043120 [Plasmodium coatneyi]
MCYPKNENERSTEGQLAENIESAHMLKKELSELYTDEGYQHCEKTQPENTSHFVSSGSAKKKRETAKGKHNPEGIHKNVNAHEKKEDDGVDQNGQTNTERTNTKKHKSSTDEPPTGRKKKKKKKKI